MRCLFLLFFFVSGAFAQTISTETPAEEAASRVKIKLGLGYQLRVEKMPSSNEQTQGLSVPSAFVQVDYREYELHTEYEQFSLASSEGNYSINTTRDELLLIARYRWLFDDKGAIFGGLGGGWGREKIKTTVGGSSVTMTGDLEQVVALDAGLQYQFTKRIFSEVGLRGLKLENLEPWIVAVGMRLGVQL